MRPGEDAHVQGAILPPADKLFAVVEQDTQARKSAIGAEKATPDANSEVIPRQGHLVCGLARSMPLRATSPAPRLVRPSEVHTRRRVGARDAAERVRAPILAAETRELDQLAVQLESGAEHLLASQPHVAAQTGRPLTCRARAVDRLDKRRHGFCGGRLAIESPKTRPRARAGYVHAPDRDPSSRPVGEWTDLRAAISRTSSHTSSASRHARAAALPAPPLCVVEALRGDVPARAERGGDP